MEDYEPMTAQGMIRASRESVIRAAFYVEDAQAYLLETRRRLWESELRIQRSDLLVGRMLISQREDPWE